MAGKQVIFRVHALRRMFERRIREEDILHVLATGEVIEDYPTDFPYPSRLVLGWCENRAIHVVAAYNKVANETIIVTAYEPDLQKWEADFKRRRP
jgi:hypothetical protein